MRLSRVINVCSKIVGCKFMDLGELYRRALLRKSILILNDNSHPLNESFKYLPSGRRLLVPRARKNVFLKSFVPAAVKILNANTAKL